MLNFVDRAIDDDYNGNPPGWEVHSTVASTGAWTSNDAGDFLRVRMHAPPRVGWIARGYTRDAASVQYKQLYIAFGRLRDINGFNHFDQK